MVLGHDYDPVGLVGCRVSVTWDDPEFKGEFVCVVDAYVPDRKAYVMSWISDRSEHSCSAMRTWPILHSKSFASRQPCAKSSKVHELTLLVSNGRCVLAGLPSVPAVLQSTDRGRAAD